MLYFGRRYSSAVVGIRLVDVICDHCGCAYCYELARIGSGAANPAYAIGTGRAIRSASEQAQTDVVRRLEEEAELVPCPKCHWINDALISRYRLGVGRGWVKGAAVLGTVGTALSLVVAWSTSRGHAADHSVTSKIALGGPAVSIAVAGLILLLQQFLRGRIRPNRNYPLPPRLPPGSPVALIRNPATGTLQPVRPAEKPGDGSAAWIDYQIGRSAFPSVCCDCLAPAAPASSFQRPIQPAVNLVVPFCTACARRWTWWIGLGGLVAFVTVAVVSLSLLLVALDLRSAFASLLVVGIGVATPFLGARLARFLTAPVRIKVADKSRGVVRLWFRNEDFPKRVTSQRRVS